MVKKKVNEWNTNPNFWSSSTYVVLFGFPGPASQNTLAWKSSTSTFRLCGLERAPARRDILNSLFQCINQPRHTLHFVTGTWCSSLSLYSVQALLFKSILVDSLDRPFQFAMSIFHIFIFQLTILNYNTQ